MTNTITVSLIATTLNERSSLEAWGQAIANQTRLPDQIIIVDGGSTDGTYEWLQSWVAPIPKQVVSQPGANISEGRNRAFDEATGNVIAITDLGTIAEPDWLARLVSPLSDPSIDVVGGFFLPQTGSSWIQALGAATLPDVDEIDPQTFLPSSRSVAVRASWIRAGMHYPVWLDYCEDLIWDLQLKNAGARFAFAPDAIVRFEVRPTPGAFFRQYFRYARGDGKSGLFARRHAVRYTTYLLALTVLIRRRPWELALVAMAGSLYIRRPIRRLFRRDRPSLVTLLLIPFIVATGDVAKMAGYPVGLIWKARKFGCKHLPRGWRRVTPTGEVWNPAAPGGAPPRQED